MIHKSSNIIASKWRPQNFSEVIGQQHVVIALSNAIKNDKVGHAYLFSGARGVGKTTIARILTKSLNCNSKLNDFDPCNDCENCQNINQTKSMDYQEIDGASNRGIDNAREINSSINYSSPTGNYRIFVIDEVHMLTTEAFNALLKSIEEPPEKVVFIFCTTESHKIPATIQSRCQHFVFKNFSPIEIKKQLEKISQQENIMIDEESLIEVAKFGKGSMRDAQNIFEQVISYCNGDIKLEQVYQIFGKTSRKTKIDFLIHLHKKQLKENKEIIDVLQNEGKSISVFIYDLIEVINHLVFIINKIPSDSLYLSKEIQQEYQNITNNFSVEELYSIQDILFEFLNEIKKDSEDSVLVDLMLIKLNRLGELP